MQTANLNFRRRKKRSEFSGSVFGCVLFSEESTQPNTLGSLTPDTWLENRKQLFRSSSTTLSDDVCDCAAKRLTHNPNTLEFWLENFRRLVFAVFLLFGCSSWRSFTLPTALSMSVAQLFSGTLHATVRLLNFGERIHLENRFRLSAKKRREEKTGAR